MTYLLMSGTTQNINDASEQEALALLAENAVQKRAEATKTGKDRTSD